jgi:hypothetical protein
MRLNLGKCLLKKPNYKGCTTILYTVQCTICNVTDRAGFSKRGKDLTSSYRIQESGIQSLNSVEVCCETYFKM